jgi:hypothetical protein
VARFVVGWGCGYRRGGGQLEYTSRTRKRTLADGSSIDYSSDPDEGVANGRKKSIVMDGILFPLNLYVRLYWNGRSRSKTFSVALPRVNQYRKPKKTLSPANHAIPNMVNLVCTA